MRFLLVKVPIVSYKFALYSAFGAHKSCFVSRTWSDSSHWDQSGRGSTQLFCSR